MTPADGPLMAPSDVRELAEARGWTLQRAARQLRPPIEAVEAYAEAEGCTLRDAAAAFGRTANWAYKARSKRRAAAEHHVRSSPPSEAVTAQRDQREPLDEPPRAAAPLVKRPPTEIEQVDRLLEAAALGLKQADCARFAGLNPEKVRRWLRQGRKGHERWADLAQRFDQARAEDLVKCMRKVAEVRDGDTYGPDAKAVWTAAMTKAQRCHGYTESAAGDPLDEEPLHVVEAENLAMLAERITARKARPPKLDRETLARQLEELADLLEED